MYLTKQQRLAVSRLYNRAINSDVPFAGSYRAFRKTIVQGYDCVMVNIWNMWIGIEKDGYTHS